MEISQLVESITQWLLAHGTRLVLILVLALVLLRVARVVIRRVFDRISRKRDQEEEFQKRAQTPEVLCALRPELRHRNRGSDHVPA